MSSMHRYRLRSHGRFARAGHLAAIAIVVTAFGAAASVAAAGTAGEVNIVSQGKPPKNIPANTHYFKKIQEAVNASKSGAYVLIEPGVYYEAVTVTRAHSGIWIRGMNRNKVILDGQNKAGNGIEIYKANNVWVENLTVRNFDTGPGCNNNKEEGEEGCGNEIWWNGGAQSSKIGASGWYGSYLTAYDTGLNGGYGIFTGHETKGSWNHIYASGFNDSGMYLGACQECEATITGAVMEKNALGYSGSNSGGRLLIENSLFQHNAVGIVPNSEKPGDKPPPQDGECNRENIEKPNPTPEIKSTNIKRCTIIRNDVVTANNNLTVEVNESTEAGAWGVGIILPGDYADLVEKNVISNNENGGLFGLEREVDGTIFGLSGNRISSNVFADNGYLGGYLRGDVTLVSGYAELVTEGLLESQSKNNCVSANVLPDPTFPAKIQQEWGCQNKTTPNPGGGLEAYERIGELQAEAKLKRTPVGQPAPPAQSTMPNPCEGVPKNPLCS
jgi:pectin methylesterase-like acyl-CoA thioesterase